MTVTSMEYFVMLARERSFTKAAERLHITQQSLSAHIAALEKELGCQLLIRRVPLELTYAGQVFLRYATEFQQNTAAMRQELCDISGNHAGTLRIGIAYTRGRAIMPELIQVFQRRYPNITIELAEASNDALHRNLLKGEIDLAIANFPHSLPGIALRDFYEEEVILLLPKAMLPAPAERQALARGDIRSLENCPFLMGNPEDIAAQIGQAAFRKANIHPPIRVRSDNVETLLSLCARGLGACFCPENLARASLSDAQMEKLEIIRLGEDGKYPIRFGYLKTSYQWSVIAEFVRAALEG